MTKRACGVYQILCIVTGKRYIGSSFQISVRWSQHRTTLKRGVSACLHLQRAWAKYGPEAFEFSILEECDKGILEEREQFYIDTLKPELNSITIVRERYGPEVRAKIVAATRARAAAITHCPNGHLYDETNSYLDRKGSRICRRCNAERVSAIYASETPEQREARRQAAKAYHIETREERLAAQREYTSRPEVKDAKADYDREHRAEANERRRILWANETPEETEARRASKMEAHHRRLGREDGKAPPRVISEEQRAKISATLKAKPAKSRAWEEAGFTSKTSYYRHLRLNGENAEAEREKLRAEKRERYHANGDKERAYMRERYRKRVASTTERHEGAVAETTGNASEGLS